MVRAHLPRARDRSGKFRRLSGGQRFQDGVERLLFAVGEVPVGLRDIVEAGVETDDRDCDVAQAGEIAGRMAVWTRQQSSSQVKSRTSCIASMRQCPRTSSSNRAAPACCGLSEVRA